MSPKHKPALGGPESESTRHRGPTPGHECSHAGRRGRAAGLRLDAVVLARLPLAAERGGLDRDLPPGATMREASLSMGAACSTCQALGTFAHSASWDHPMLSEAADAIGPSPPSPAPRARWSRTRAAATARSCCGPACTRSRRAGSASTWIQRRGCRRRQARAEAPAARFQVRDAATGQNGRARRSTSARGARHSSFPAALQGCSRPPWRPSRCCGKKPVGLSLPVHRRLSTH